MVTINWQRIGYEIAHFLFSFLVGLVVLVVMKLCGASEFMMGAITAVFAMSAWEATK